MANTVADFYGVLAVTPTRQVDTITLSSVTPAALSKTGIMSYPSTETAGASPTADIIKVFDTTTSQNLVLGTDYTLTASGAGPTLTYSVTRISSSSNSANGNSATVTYIWGDTKETTGQLGVAGTAPTGTAFKAGTTDTEGGAAGGLGSAGGYGSLTDPAMGKQSSSETGAPGSEYKATPAAPSTYGWPSGVPDTESVYGGGLPESFAPTDTSLRGVLETTGTGTSDLGSNLVPSEFTSPNGYRAPSSGVAAGSKDTTLTDILGNQASAPVVPSQTAYQASYVDTSYVGAPAAPTALKSQTDTVTGATASGTPRYYLSQLGVVTSSIVVRDTTTSANLVLGTDYAVTSSGNGPVTAAYIVMTAGTNFTNGNNIAITYNYGDAQYYDSNVPASVPGAPGTPTATAGNRSVKLAWSPPSGTTQVDYYMVQSLPDLGTQYVPALGQPVLDGQPSGSGASAGQPTYQADTLTLLTSALAAPSAPTVTPTGTGGTLTAGVYKAAVTYVNANGESVASGTTTASSLTSGQDLVITSPSAVTGATGWYAYVSQSGGSTLTRQQAAGSPTAIGTNLTLTANPSSGGANPPATDSSVPTLTKTGIITPAQQVIVRDNSRVGNDPLQADGQVLEYGYDYTITQTGVGPWTSYTVVLVANSVNAKAGDSITVEYWWGQDPSTVSTVFTQGIQDNVAVIYKPDGSTPYTQGYTFRVAAGNRAGLGPYSAASAAVVPLNYNAPQPGHEGSTQTITALDPANTINPVYKPDGTIKSGTGLGG